MFGHSRRLIEALQKSTASVRELTTELREGRGGRDYPEELAGRLEGLELSRAKWEAEMEAELLKADSRYKAASNAESRARTQARHDEKIVTDLAPESEDSLEEYYDRLRAGNAEGGPEEGMHVVHMDMEAGNSKGKALRAKFS